MIHLQYFVKTPTGFMCKFCSKEYESVKSVICHLAKTSDNCLLVPEDARERLRQVMKAITSRKRDSTSTDQCPPSGKCTPISTIGDHLLATEIVGKQFDEYIKDIWSCLMDGDNVFTIGIHGIGGVGKTEVAKLINNKLLQNPNKFHHVFWVNLSRDCSICNQGNVSPPRRVCDLQSSISKVMGIDLSDGDDETKRAAQLSKGLAEKKKSVLILDDVWDYIPLQDVGIPVGVDRFTVIITTRSLKVCRELGCQRKIEIRCLPPDESYELFKKNIGNETVLSREAEEISRLVADRCAGLPLAIKIVTRNMRGVTDMYQWRNALRGYTQKKADMEIFQKLRTSYDYLKDLTLQHCFLYCSSLVGEISRKRFIHYWVEKKRMAEYLADEGIIKRMNSRREELDEAHTMLDLLHDAGLLEINSWNSVEMNALIRSMAFQIMEENQQRTMIKKCRSLEDFPDEESWTGDLVRVSLKCNDLENIRLNFSPSCSKLSMLILSWNRKLGCIGDSFFEGMPGLKVLNLSYTGIESLPRSVCGLVNLTTLLLQWCLKLKRIPSMAKLRSLKKLDLSFVPIEELPEDIEMLSKLTYLDLFVTPIQELKPGILSKLSHLQFLRLPWGISVKGEELGCLSRLETLNCRFYNVVEFNKYLIHLKRVKEREVPIQLDFRVGPGHVHFGDFANDVLYDDEDINAEEDEDLSAFILYDCNINEVVDMPNYFQHIVISKSKEARSLCNFSPIKSTSEVKYFSIQDWDGLEFLCSLSLTGQDVLEKIKYMELSNLKNLSVLLSREGNVAYGSSCFSNLTKFLIQDCPSIKRLFPVRLLGNLKNLQRLYVFDCHLMEEIFAAEEEEEESNTGGKKEISYLSRLCIFWLQYLPELKRVCGGRTICAIPKSCSMKVLDCPKLIARDGLAVYDTSAHK